MRGIPDDAESLFCFGTTTICWYSWRACERERELIVNVMLVGLALVAVFILTLTLYLWWQSTIKPAPYEAMFEIRESDAVRIRRGEDGWLITPTNGAKPLTLRSGTNPDALGLPRALAHTNGSYHAVENYHRHKRYFFEIDLDNGQSVQIAERVLALEGATNFRDIGGYEAADGGRVAWGKVYRAGELVGLTDHDLAVLQQLGIRHFCDLRADAEARKRPDRIPHGVRYLHLPVFKNDPVGFRALFLRHRLDPMMQKLYSHYIIDKGAPTFGNLFRLVADPANLPLVIHCAGGKDRTGVAVALLLHICGVTRATIIADYSLTNYAAETTVKTIRELLATRRPPGLKIEQIYPLLSARPALLEQAFAHIETTYGSVDAYLRDAVGLTDTEINAIRENLVV